MEKAKNAKLLKFIFSNLLGLGIIIIILSLINVGIWMGDTYDLPSVDQTELLKDVIRHLLTIYSVTLLGYYLATKVADKRGWILYESTLTPGTRLALLFVIQFIGTQTGFIQAAINLSNISAIVIAINLVGIVAYFVILVYNFQDTKKKVIEEVESSSARWVLLVLLILIFIGSIVLFPIAILWTLFLYYLYLRYKI